MEEKALVNLAHRTESRERFNYKGMHRYIVTLTTFRSSEIFTNKETVVTILNELRDTSLQYRFDVYAYCFLPHELRLILRGKTDDADMKELLFAFREHTSGAMEPKLGHKLWKRTFTERVLRKSEDTRQIAEQIFRLPNKAGLVKEGERYPYVGSFVIPADKMLRSRRRDRSRRS